MFASEVDVSGHVLRKGCTWEGVRILEFGVRLDAVVACWTDQMTGIRVSHRAMMVPWLPAKMFAYNRGAIWPLTVLGLEV